MSDWLPLQALLRALSRKAVRVSRKLPYSNDPTIVYQEVLWRRPRRSGDEEPNQRPDSSGKDLKAKFKRDAYEHDARQVFELDVFYLDDGTWLFRYCMEMKVEAASAFRRKVASYELPNTYLMPSPYPVHVNY